MPSRGNAVGSAAGVLSLKLLMTDADDWLCRQN
jgi:hypothetical protein